MRLIGQMRLGDWTLSVKELRWAPQFAPYYTIVKRGVDPSVGGHDVEVGLTLSRRDVEWVLDCIKENRTVAPIEGQRSKPKIEPDLVAKCQQEHDVVTCSTYCDDYLKGGCYYAE